MTFTDAENKAKRSQTYARYARRDAQNRHEEHLAQAIELLAEAVAEMAGATRRASR